MVAADGSLVPIDFGYCFGAATMLLPVPELVPFRLTPTMLAPLRPQAAERAGSTLHSDAASTLRALRRARRQLVGVAEIFVREPLGVQRFQHATEVLCRRFHYYAVHVLLRRFEVARVVADLTPAARRDKRSVRARH